MIHDIKVIWKSRCYVFPAFICVIFVIILLLLGRPRLPLPPPTSINPSMVAQQMYAANVTDRIYIPRIVHQMWKTDSNTLPHELKRWSKGCSIVNKDFEFRLYTDAQLSEFVMKTYPHYTELYQSLKGVYMADMARVLIVYHFGGIYMDLDFYCHKPFKCLVDSLYRSHIMNKPNMNNVMVVSLEPLTHATIFRQKQRVVIQDFFMCTPKHPFLKWLLDDRLLEFEKQKQMKLTQDNVQYTKGPFSYSIDKDIDRYHEYIRSIRHSYQQLKENEKNNQQHSIEHYETHKTSLKHILTHEIGYIIELSETVLHSLVDQTNSRLYSVCNSNEIPSMAISSCQKIHQKQFFNPTQDTIAVHMWTHIYLTLNMLRTMYSRSIYENVEKALPPTLTC